MEGYKVFYRRYETGELWSPIQGPNSGMVQYKEGEWTERVKGNGPLAVFDSYYNAHSFITSWVGIPFSRIYECVYDESKDSQLWYIGQGTGKRITCPCVPTGTRFADRVKITILLYGLGTS